MIPLTIADFFKAADGIFQLGDFTRNAQEYFGHQERLRQEAFDTASAMHDQLVRFAQFVDTENGDDVLQFAIALESRLHATSHCVVVAPT